MAYANTERQSISTAEPVILQTGPTSFIAVPTRIGESVGNSDTVVTTIGLRRGITAKAEVYGRLPVVLYVKHRKNDHFTVLRGISGDVVFLADPSQGNRTYSRDQFLAMWETRSGADDGLTGRFLAVLPVSGSTKAPGDFFTRGPARQSAPALSTLANRSWPP